MPALLPLLPGAMGVGFVELGLALTLFNVVTAVVQAPMGILVDRRGARPVLVGGLALAALALLLPVLFGSYAALLAASALLGVANAVYHPADYDMLSRSIAEARIGRAFSIHTFAGFLGGALAPGAMLGLAALFGPLGALAAAGLLGLLAAIPLALARRDATVAAATLARPAARTAAAGAKPATNGLVAVLTPAVVALTLFFTLLSLSTGGVQNFSVVALAGAHGVSFAAATAALTAWLTLSALGVLAGGIVADRTRRHGEVAAAGFGGHGGAGAPGRARCRCPTRCWSRRSGSRAFFPAPSCPRATCWCAPPRRRAPPAASSASSPPASTSAARSGR